MPILNLKNLKTNNEQFGWLLFDLFMILLAIVNITLIIFDFTFSYDVGKSLYQTIWPKGSHWYESNIHSRFIYIDLCFVAVFLIEFSVRWIIAIRKKEFQSWIIFPFARWYDILGLIPIGSFRFLRILRVISIVLRLNRMGVLSLRDLMDRSGLGFYYSIFLEEVSDRVVINVLNSAQGKIHSNDEIIKDVVGKVLKPNNDRLVAFSLERTRHITSEIFASQKDEMRRYILEKVKEAIAQNKEMKLIGNVPGLGDVIKKQLNSAVGDITFHVIAGIIEDVAEGKDVFSKEVPRISEDILSTFENDEELEGILKDIVNQTIEIVKERVQRKDWLERKYSAS